MKLIRVHTLATILNVLVFSSIYIFVPQLRNSLLKENQFLENLTAVLFFGSFVAGLILLKRSKGKRHSRAYLAIPLMGLFCFLEEIDYAQRIFQITKIRFHVHTPTESHFIGIDNVHDFLGFLPVFYRVYGAYFLYPLLIALCILILSVILLIRRYRYKIPEIIKTHPPLRFALIFVGFTLIALLMDLLHKPVANFSVQVGIMRRVGHAILHWKFLEELFEMNAALSLLFASFSLGCRSSSE
jgi:hypothetical protein